MENAVIVNSIYNEKKNESKNIIFFLLWIVWNVCWKHKKKILLQMSSNCFDIRCSIVSNISFYCTKQNAFNHLHCLIWWFMKKKVLKYVLIVKASSIKSSSNQKHKRIYNNQYLNNCHSNRHFICIGHILYINIIHKHIAT